MGGVASGPDVIGLVFKDPKNKPERWVWSGLVDMNGERVEWARPQRRSNADKIELKELRGMEDKSAKELKKVFYNSPFGFVSTSGNRLLGVGVKAARGVGHG